MNRNIVLLIMLVFATLNIFAADFQGSNFGDSKAKVIKTLKNKHLENINDDLLMLSGR